MPPTARRRTGLIAGVLVVLVVAAAVAVLVLRAGNAPGQSWSSAGATSGSATSTPAARTTSSTPATGHTTTTAAPPSTSAPVTAQAVTVTSRDTGGPVVSTEPPTSFATDPPYTAAKGQADVSITYAGWEAAGSTVEVDGYVGGLVEDGGSCTLTLTRGQATATVSADASADATTTDCGPLTVPGSRLSSGTWKAQVAYRSSWTSGTSGTVEVTVP